MKLPDRIERYAAIEEYRDRPLIVYATSTRAGVGARMAGDAVREFIDQIDLIRDVPAIDVLLHSTGGDALTAWKLMSLLRERYDEVAVLVPFMAFSAATIFALGADEIVMHPHASLGPIDPQISIPQEDGGQRAFSFEDVGAFLRFLKEEIGVTEQAYISASIDALFQVVDPLHVGASARASELSTDVGERLLQTHMTGPEERANARRIAENLNKSFFAHGDAVSRSRARELELRIADDDEELENLLWDAFLGIESYMELRRPFNALQHFLADPAGEQSVEPIRQLAIPPNAPAQLVQQIWQQAANTALQGLGQPGTEVGYDVVNAIIESPRCASEFRTEGKMTAARLPGGDIQLSATDRAASWRTVYEKPEEEHHGEEEAHDAGSREPRDEEEEGAEAT